ncbi:MAG: DUF115 domain-containing protein [Alphaproteobacteria bacterium]|nr:DUF115 domain-containing protein [Alphaproteobacteria bacterium]
MGGTERRAAGTPLQQRCLLMAETSLYEKNLLFFTAAYPPVAEMLPVRETDLTQAVFNDDGAIVDIDLGQGLFYNRPAAEFAAEQVAAYMARPTRIVVEPPNFDDLHDACTHKMATQLEAAAPDRLPQPPLDRGGILLIIGIGLGLHISDLIAQTGARHVILVEPITEFLDHSLSVLDWQAMWAQCTEAGATIDIIAGGDPAGIRQRLEPLMLRFGETAIDGSYIYLHYQTDVTKAVAAGFHDLAGMTAILKGYYADEKLMVENTTANVATHDFWLIEGELRAPIDAPVFVVGAGPSLDASIEIIRKWQDRAIIVTAGSTLQVLLHQGIVPDFHVEKENTQPTVDRLRHIRTRAGDQFEGDTFGSIRLVASTTVKPGVTELFDEKFLFLRSALSSTAMFGAGHRPIDGTSPYSANAALTLAAIMGFRNVYLFGCDCGARDASHHHSGETAYYTLDSYPDRGVDFSSRAPGNFGGEVLTNSYFAWSRQTYEQVIAAAGLTVRNCSDGVMIGGAQPLPPDDLVLTNAPLDKTAIAEAVKTSSVHFTPGAYLIDQDVAAVTNNWNAFAGELRAQLDTSLDTADDIHRFDQQLRGFLDGAATKFGGVTIMVAGSARSMAPVAGYYLNRAPDAAAQASLMDVFRATYRAEIERILDDGTALMAGLDAAPAPALSQAG